MIDQQSEDGQYRTVNGHLYVREEGRFPGDAAYVHCYQNPLAKTMKQLINEYEEIEDTNES